MSCATTSFATKEEALSFLEHNPDIEMFELFILDNNGVPRGKLLHRDELLAVYESGRPLPSTILGLTINGDDVENSGLVWDVGDIDCRAYPISGSLQRMPWRLIPTAAVQVSMHPKEGMPATIVPNTGSSWAKSVSRTGAGICIRLSLHCLKFGPNAMSQLIVGFFFTKN